MDRDDKALRRIISQLTGEWQSQAEEAADALFELLKKGKPLAVALRIIKEQYAELFTIPHLQDALVESACAGFGVSVSSLDKQTIAKVGHALSESWTGDELITLSQRIRGMGEEMSRTIVDTISAQMRANQSWIEASRALYDGYDGGHLLEQADIPEYLKMVRRATQGSPEALKEARKALGNIDRLSRNGAPTKALKAAYNELVDSALIGTEEQMEKAVHTAMEEKSRYIADRIIRTENARAWADGFIARADADEDCIGYEWVMDTRHPVIDICDFHSQVDAFGMGPGKFPKGKAPAMPAHPHCLCRFVEVYKSKNQPKDQRAKAGREWLEELSEADRKRVLGKQGAEAFDKGKDWVKSSKNLKLGKQESRLAEIDLEGRGDNKTFIKERTVERNLQFEYPGLTKSESIKLNKLQQELLKFSKNENNSDEVAFIVSSKISELSRCKGNENSLDFSKKDLRLLATQEDITLLHNHPKGKTFSLTDINFWLDHQKVKTICIITNRGRVEALTKTKDYNRIELTEAYMKFFGDILVKKANKEINDSEFDLAIDEKMPKFLKSLGEVGAIWKN